MDVTLQEYFKGKERAAAAQDDFDNLDGSLTGVEGDKLRKKWQKQEDKAAADRLRRVTAMDVYNSKIAKRTGFIRVIYTGLLTPSIIVPGRQDVEVELRTEALANAAVPGISKWIVSGLEIEQEQISIALDSNELGAYPTPYQQLELVERKEKVMALHEDFMEQADNLFPLVPFDELEFQQAQVKMNPDGTPKPQKLKAVEPYQQPVPLPSRLLRPLHTDLEPVRQLEIKLRVAEANDALTKIRETIAYKSYIYLEKIRPYKSKKYKTRGWTTLRNTDAELTLHVKHYKNARNALIGLQADKDILERFKDISKKQGHLNTVTAVAEPNARGQSSGQTAWFWGMDVAGDSSSNAYMNDCAYVVFTSRTLLTRLPVHRVNWLRKKAYRDRWVEELELLQCEMAWIRNYFNYQARQWRLLAVAAGKGKSSSAFKFSEMWDHLQDYAVEKFQNRGDARETMEFEDVEIPPELVDYAGVEEAGGYDTEFSDSEDNGLSESEDDAMQGVDPGSPPGDDSDDSMYTDREE